MLSTDHYVWFANKFTSFVHEATDTAAGRMINVITVTGELYGTYLSLVITEGSN